MGIPPGLTADHIGRAIKYIDSGGTHKFSKASKYHLVNKTTGIHYPPKAVVGIACQYLPDGRILESDEFSSGVGSGQAVHLLKKLLKDDPNYEIRELNKEPEGTEELSLRRMHWDDLKSKYGSPCRDVPPKLLNDKKIFFGGRGIWRDKQRTSSISPNADGIAMGVLHTGAITVTLSRTVTLFMTFRTPKTPRQMLVKFPQ